MQNTSSSIASVMRELGKNARAASSSLAVATGEQKKLAITAAADSIDRNVEKIIDANETDMEAARAANLSAALIDRLRLDESRVAAIASALREIAALDDPIGSVMAQWQRPNGLRLKRVRTPLGVIGVIYESRPNVTADAGALCLLAGNAVVLRGGSDSLHSSRAIHECLEEGLVAADLPEASIQLVPVSDRVAVAEMLTGLGGNIDVIVPRGGKSLVQRVQSDCRVPVFAHLEGICHVYVDATAKVQMATEVVFNSKMRRPGICGAAETLLIQRDAIASHLRPILDRLVDGGCEIRGDETVCQHFGSACEANEEDWRMEYLDAVISVKTVADVEEAISHIDQFSSGHTESIVSEDAAAVEKFLTRIDSAILMHNASTQFADGGEFGMGAEIGIATGKMHARGPVGVEQLTSFNYRVLGNGHVRP